MKKIVFLFLLNVLIHFSSRSQIIVNENFTTGWNWFTISSAEIIIDKKGDVYNWERKTTGWYCTWKPCELIQSADYKISCEVKHIGGVNDHGAGFVFGQKDLDNFYSLQISANGYYAVYDVKDGQWHSLIDWTTSSNINQGNDKWNEIAIQKSGIEWQVLINGKPEKKIDVKQFYGTQIGFFVDDIQKIKFDNLKVEIIGEGLSKISSSLWEETFFDNSRGWIVGKGDYGNTAFENGMIKLTGATEGNLRNEMPTDMDFTKDFSITTSVIHQNGTKNFGYGMLFAGSDAGYFWCFLISANDGYIFFQKGPNGNRDVIIPWTSSEWINKGNEMNTMMVKSEGGDFQLYVNNHLLTSIGKRKSFGSRIGLYVENKQEVWFDNIAISTMQTESNETVLLQENFNDLNSPCRQNNTDYSSHITKDNKLWVDLYNSDANYMCDLNTSGLNYETDYTITAELETNCDTVVAGIVWMVNGNTAYQFVIVGPGYSVMRTKKNGESTIISGLGINEGKLSKGKQISYLFNMTSQPGFTKARNRGVFAKNYLRIDVNGSQMTFYMNNEQVASIYEGSNNGISGVDPYAGGNAGTVVFDNIKVIKR